MSKVTLAQLKQTALARGFTPDQARQYGKLTAVVTWETLLASDTKSLDTGDKPVGVRVLGLDICKASVVGCLLTKRPEFPRDAYHSVEFFTINADAAGIKQLLDLKPDVAIMEPTGINYQRLWGTQLARAGVEVRLVSNNKLPSYRSLLDLPDKDDEADSLALACYYFDFKDSPRRFLQVRDRAIVRIRELSLRLQHYNRLQSPIINRLRQDLAWQFPEVASVKSEIGAQGDAPLLWGWIAGLRRSAKYDRLYEQTVGSGLIDETRFSASMLCSLMQQERKLELELCQLVTSDTRFFPYRKVFTKFGFGLRLQALLLSQIFPIENYFSEDGKPEVIIRKGKNSKKPTKRYLSERRFMKSLGLAPTRQWSGDDKKKSRKAGSDILRTAFWQWVYTRIESGRARLKNEIGSYLSGYLLEAKAQGQPVKLIRARTACKAARLLWKELLAEFAENSQ